jgi:hypothetical protein
MRAKPDVVARETSAEVPSSPPSVLKGRPETSDRYQRTWSCTKCRPAAAVVDKCLRAVTTCSQSSRFTTSRPSSTGLRGFQLLLLLLLEDCWLLHSSVKIKDAPIEFASSNENITASTHNARLSLAKITLSMLWCALLRLRELCNGSTQNEGESPASRFALCPVPRLSSITLVQHSYSPILPVHHESQLFEATSTRS